MSASPAAQLFDSAVGPLETIPELQSGLAAIIKKHTNLAVWLACAASETDGVNATSLIWLLVPIAL